MNQEEIDSFLAACAANRVESEKRDIAKAKMDERIASSTFKKTTTFNNGGSGITTLAIVNGAVVYKRFHD